MFVFFGSGRGTQQAAVEQVKGPIGKAPAAAAAKLCSLTAESRTVGTAKGQRDCSSWVAWNVLKMLQFPIVIQNFISSLTIKCHSSTFTLYIFKCINKFLVLGAVAKTVWGDKTFTEHRES